MLNFNLSVLFDS